LLTLSHSCRTKTAKAPPRRETPSRSTRCLLSCSALHTTLPLTPALDLLLQLRNLFSLHEGVACQTHELTGCRCHLGEVPDADADGADADDSSDDDDDDDDEMEGFVQASQFQDDDAIRKVRSNPFLSLSCSASSRRRRADSPLSSSCLCPQISKQRRNLSILKTWTHYDCADERALDELDDGLLQSVIYERMLKADQAETPIPHEGNGGLFVRGGQVGFVFGKKTSAPAEEVEVESVE